MSAVADPIVSSPQADEPPPPLVFTDSAANKVKELVDEEGNPDLKLRVFVQGGGCSGFQYKFDMERARAADDLAIELGDMAEHRRRLVEQRVP